VARNGRVLLASDRPLEALAGRVASLRLQTWHKRILPGDAPEPYGVLVYVRSEERPDQMPVYQGTLFRSAEEAFNLGLELGARLVLGFRRTR
jgi:hypothetical protein